MHKIDIFIKYIGTTNIWRKQRSAERNNYYNNIILHSAYGICSRAYNNVVLLIRRFTAVFRSVRESVATRWRQKGGEAQEHGFQMQFEPDF